MLNGILNALDATMFASCFTDRVPTLTDSDPDIIAIDGKTSRRSHDQGQEPLHLVSAWISRRRLVISRQAGPQGSNEIKVIPLPLERLALQACPVTIDAMGCQTKIARAILDKGADHPLAAKRNGSNLHDEITRYFKDRPDDTGTSYTMIDADHGRIETRRHRVSHDVGFLNTSRHFPDEPRFPDLKPVAMVASEVEHGGKPSQERRYYLC